MKKIVLITWCLLMHAQVFAQQNNNWNFVRPTNTGLTGGAQLTLEIDRCGNKWTSSFYPFYAQGSLVRFDDSIWTAWSNYEGYIPSARVYSIAWDLSDNLFVGTDHGLARYDGLNWTHWTVANSALPYDQIRGIVCDANNDIWFTFYEPSAFDGGVGKLSGNNLTIYTTANSGLPNGRVNDIDADSSNNIWIGTDLGLVKLTGSVWSLLTNSNSGLSSFAVKDVEVDERTNKLYVATGIAIDIMDANGVWTHLNSTNAPISATGLYEVDARNDSVIIGTVGGTYKSYIFNGSTWISRPQPDHCYDVRIDNDGNFWTCGNGGFMYRWDGTSWTDYNNANTNLNSHFNYDLFIDSKNRKWFASMDNGGINMFDCSIWRDYSRNNAGLWPNPIGTLTATGSGIAEDMDGDIWMAYNGTQEGLVQIPAGNVNTSPAGWTVWNNNNAGVSMQGVSCVIADSSNNIWVGYDGACAVSKYSKTTQTWTNYNLYALGQTTCGAGSKVRRIKTDPEHNVWVCGDAGLARYDTSGNWTFYSYLNTPMLQGTIFDMDVDAQGNKWIATQHKLYKFDNVNWTWYDTANSAIAGNVVTAVAVRNGKVYVGARDASAQPGGGLSIFDGSAWTTYLRGSSPYPDVFTNRLAFDSSGNLWCNTDLWGAAIFNPNGVQNTDCIDRTIQKCTPTVPTTVSMSGLAPDFEMYPNPASDRVTIACSQTSGFVFVRDITGKILLRQRVKQGSNLISLSNLNSGIYLVEYEAAGGRALKKLVIQ